MSEPSSFSGAGLRSVSFIGNYMPRLCGIATFTTDLLHAMAADQPETRFWTVAMNDKPEGYPYPERVRFEIDQNELSDYRKAAEFINMNQADVVSLQHEYGIFGGSAGSYILKMLDELNMPVVTTLHTILTDPPEPCRRVLMDLAELSDRLVVMSGHAADVLETLYEVDRERISVIPHGIPDFSFIDPDYFKERLNLLGRQTLLTFGLLSRNKGIEYVVEALPEVVEQHPDLVYIILGKTHPHVRDEEGEAYREELQERVSQLGLTDNVIFENRFVSSDELEEYLSAADLYITPYVNEEQITSGTLAYAMGTGKAVISTPYWHAREMLSQNRGELVPFRNSKAMASAIDGLLSDSERRSEIRIRAYDYSRSAVWSDVARQYRSVFEEVARQQVRQPAVRIHSSIDQTTVSDDITTGETKLPPIKLDHLITLSDDTGILQHATYAVPNRDHGYCTDDNARALILAGRLKQLMGRDRALLEKLFSRYFSFVTHAFDEETGRFRNFMSYERGWLEDVGSADSHGRSVWALGQLIATLDKEPELQLAASYFRWAMPATTTFDSLRSIAFSLIGLDAYLTVYPGDSEAKRLVKVLGEKLFRAYSRNATRDWPWPEDKLTYANARLSQAMIIAGRRLKRDEMLEAGLHSLTWLVEVQSESGHLSPVGNAGWYPRYGDMARFDQQPLEANGLVEACIDAYHTTGDVIWIERTQICFNWFLGLNDLDLPVYNMETGGCRDGLEQHGLNLNEGAESTLAWLLSLTAMYELERDRERTEVPRVEEIDDENLDENDNLTKLAR